MVTSNHSRPESKPLRIIRPGAQMKSKTGNAKSTEYDKVTKGLMTHPISIGERSSGWPEHEVDAIIRARIAGWSDDQIRKLVLQLEADRENHAPYAEAGLDVAEEAT